MRETKATYMRHSVAAPPRLVAIILPLHLNVGPVTVHAVGS